MKLIKSGSTYKMTITRAEWKSIGTQNGWFASAQIAAPVEAEPQQQNEMPIDIKQTPTENASKKIGKLVVVDGQPGMLERYEKTQNGVSAICHVWNGRNFSFAYYPTNKVQTASPQNLPKEKVIAFMKELQRPGYKWEPDMLEKIQQQVSDMYGIKPNGPVQGRLF